MNSKDISGNKYGKLTVLDFEESRTVGRVKKRFYKCLCECGTIKIICGDNLKSGISKTCGCSILNRTAHNRLPEGDALWNRHYSTHKEKNAKKRSIESTLTREQFIDLCSMNCYYCDATPSSRSCKWSDDVIFANGIDRIDSNLGYTIDNIRPCCSMCNYMKLDYSEQEFLDKVEEISNNMNRKEE